MHKHSPIEPLTHHLAQTLKKYIPEQSVDLCVNWIVEHKVLLRITRERSSKLGDYQSPWGGKGHRISVNHNLNPFAFLITFVHEMAHLVAFEKHKNRIQPHGKEWKQEFRTLMNPFFQTNIFPDDITRALQKYLHNPAAGTCSDQHLLRVLHRYDPQQHPKLRLEQLPPGSVFLLKTKQQLVLKKGPLLRTRFECKEVYGKRTYLVNALAEVELLSEAQIQVF